MFEARLLMFDLSFDKALLSRPQDFDNFGLVQVTWSVFMSGCIYDGKSV
jgi:hypothetical protein